MNRLIAIVGPTAVGKSAMAMHLAQVFGGEIVSADSRQIYRYMDIGTAKPSPDEMAIVPHHLIDIADPDQDFTLAIYQKMASSAIADIQRRGNLALLVGGSGLYVKAITGGLQIPKVAPDAALRHSLEDKAKREGYASLHVELKRVDPVSAERIDPRNVRRMVRALEVYHATGIPFSRHQKESPPSHTLTIGLTTARDDLYGRIDHRVDNMMQRGFIDEVQELLGRGYSLDLPAMSSLGYRQVGQFLKGETGLEEAVQRIKHDTHRFARHQYAWFRPGDESICWCDIRNGDRMRHDVQELVSEFAGIEPTKQLSRPRK